MEPPMAGDQGEDNGLVFEESLECQNDNSMRLIQPDETELALAPPDDISVDASEHLDIGGRDELDEYLVVLGSSPILENPDWIDRIIPTLVQLYPPNRPEEDLRAIAHFLVFELEKASIRCCHPVEGNNNEDGDGIQEFDFLEFQRLVKSSFDHPIVKYTTEGPPTRRPRLLLPCLPPQPLEDQWIFEKYQWIFDSLPGCARPQSRSSSMAVTVNHSPTTNDIQSERHDMDTNKRKRGPYKCSICDAPKENHVCPLMRVMEDGTEMELKWLNDVQTQTNESTLTPLWNTPKISGASHLSK